MTSRPRRRLSRPREGTRRYRTLFFVATEGSVSEPQYFSMLGNRGASVCVKCLKRGTGNAPKHVLRDMRRWLAEKGLRAGDQAWIVVDTDSWPEQQLLELHRWAAGDPRYGLAVSNPKFEFWLLLHFEDGNGAATSAQCTRRLQRHLPHYDKGIRATDFPAGTVEQAAKRARKRNTLPCPDWPRTPPGTTVYRLVDEIMAAAAAE